MGNPTKGFPILFRQIVRGSFPHTPANSAQIVRNMANLQGRFSARFVKTAEASAKACKNPRFSLTNF